MWSLLLLTLPAKPNAIRLRTWRTLKGLGVPALRDGAYVLPTEHAEVLSKVAEEVRAHHGNAWLLEMTVRSPAQQLELLALFDRAGAYKEWHASAEALQGAFDELGEAEARRQFRSRMEALQAIERIDYFPGRPRDQARAALDALRRELECRFSRGEPRAESGGIARLDPAQYVGRRWATRQRPWVDRLACCWLVRRFIDPDAQFLWLADIAALPEDAIGFDFDGAAFTHRGTRVTFEVMVASFGLQSDPKLLRIGAVVHYLDVGGSPVAEAAGLESILAGLRVLHKEDDRLIEATGPVFDALYASSGTTR